MRPTIAEIRVADDVAAWRSAGFTVDPAGTVRIGATTVQLIDTGDGEPGAGRGIAGWTLRGAAVPPEGTIDGLPTAVADADEGHPDADDHPGADGHPAADGTGGRGDQPAPASTHPNGCTRIDHVVAFTPDLDRTTAALAAAGIEARRTRDAGAGPDGRPRRQRFFRLGEVILELVGPATPEAEEPEPGGSGAPARFWGLAHEVDDLDATAALLGDRLSPPRPAVQPGRRIASLRRGAGVAVPTAFLTPASR